MENKNKITVKIYGSEYTLKCSERRDYIEAVARDVDKRMHAAAESMDLSPVQAAVLSAMNLCDELYKLKFENAKKQKTEEYEKQIKSLQAQCKALTDENNKLKNK